jgi:RNA polymerase sigma-70 factor (ECF subfamily)
VTVTVAPGALTQGAMGVRGADDVKQGEFEAFFSAEYPRLTRYCGSLIRNREQAEDLAQEAFSLLLARWSHVRDPTSYLYRVATNLVRRSWRRSALDRRRLLDLQRNVESTTPDATQELVLRDALSRIPRRHRDVVLLHYYAGLSVAEVALAVERPRGTVLRQLSEARERLLVQLGGSPA